MAQEGDDAVRAMLTRVARGDQEALRALFAALRPRLWGYLCRQLGGDADLTDDVLQDVFVAVWRGAGTYRGAARATAWVFRIAHNLAANALRDRGRRAEGHAAELPDDHADSAALVVAAHDDAVLDRLALEAALCRLTPPHRAVLDLVFQQGFTLEEAAGVLGIPAGTVKSRLHAARRALLAALTSSLSEAARHD